MLTLLKGYVVSSPARPITWSAIPYLPKTGFMMTPFILRYPFHLYTPHTHLKHRRRVLTQMARFLNRTSHLSEDQRANIVKTRVQKRSGYFFVLSNV